MTKYAVRILSSDPTIKPDVVRSVLACRTVSKLVFPAMLFTHPGGGVRLPSADQFDVPLVPKEFYNESLVNIPLHGENGIEFSATIYFHETIVPNVINLQFTSEHLEKRIVTLTDLKALLAEVIPVFRAYEASVYHNYHIKIPLPDLGPGAFGFEEPKYVIRTSDHRSYTLDLDWITYYGPKLLEHIGSARFAALQTCAEKYKLHGGIVVVLQEEPFRVDDPVHRERQARAEAELQLSELVAQ